MERRIEDDDEQIYLRVVGWQALAAALVILGIVAGLMLTSLI